MKAFALLLLSGLLCCGQGVVAPPTLPKPLEQPPMRPGLEISAEFSTLDLASNTVIYTSSGTNFVVATYPSAKSNEPPAIIFSRKLTGKRMRNGQLDFIEADGDVRMSHGLDFALGQKAIYVGTNDHIVLTGPWNMPPTISPRPVVGTQCAAVTNLDGSITIRCITNVADVVIYDRTVEQIFFAGNAVTYVPGEKLSSVSSTNSSRGTNSPRRTLP